LHSSALFSQTLLILTTRYAILPEQLRKIVVENHELNESVLAILGNVDVVQYQRV